jgi:tetratricopeptide (TPR) repeat protein
MPKRKRNRQRQKKVSRPARTKDGTKGGRFKAFLIWLSAPAFILAVGGFVYRYVNADVQVEFSKSLESGYEFAIRNDSPSDQLIERFRVVSPTAPWGQFLLARTTKDVVATVDNGNVVLPGGNRFYMPIGDFRELDGVPIKANSKTNFRLPPLNDRSWFQITAALLDIEYSTTSENLALRKIEKGLSRLGIANYQKRISFLVIHDYWMPVKAETVQDAITLVCREDADLRKSELCKSQLCKSQPVTSNDPAVIALKREASKALNAGELAQAEKLLTEAAIKDLKGAQQSDTMSTKHLLSAAASMAAIGGLKENQLNFSEAASYYRQAAELVEFVAEGAEVTLATYLHYWGFASYEAGDYGDSEPPLARALAIQEKVLGPEHRDVTISLITLARLYLGQGRYPEAESLLQRAVAIQEKVLGPDHPDVALTLSNLAGVYYMRAQYGQAEPLLQRTITLLEKVVGPEHWVMARGLNSLAGVYHARREYHQAEPLLRRALDIQQKTLGPEDPELTITLNNLAQLYQEQGYHGEAEPFLRQALAINEKVWGTEHPTVAIILTNLATSYYARSLYTQAEPLLTRALAIQQKRLGSEHPNLTLILNNLARVYQDQGRYAEAEPLYLRAVAIQEKMPRPEHPDLSATLNNLAILYNDQHQYAKAEPLYQRALAILKRVWGPEHLDMVLILTNYSALLRQTNRATEADELEIRATKIRAKHEPINPAAP